ncbi:hypothetical protein B0H17DRAFT_944764 [Mycena rosella]|uniref:Uncharacterized protein n=1 Tax=Mycena rosella TaxID=1033263 RepID=A0AAD7D431_MYCRO|nr:hypothetical protein B0H17DRAFT_944764 [Mycena rosella]
MNSGGRNGSHTGHGAPALSAWNEKKIAAVGGIAAWDALSAEEQSRRDRDLMAEIITALGKSLDALSPEDRRVPDLFMWAGCCMHKDGPKQFQGRKHGDDAVWDVSECPGPLHYPCQQGKCGCARAPSRAWRKGLDNSRRRNSSPSRPRRKARLSFARLRALF